MTPSRKVQDQKPSSPTVALVVGTSHASGRNNLRGISRYVRDHGSWSLFHEFRDTDVYFPEWIRSWNCDGVIARIESEQIAEALGDLNVPVVDVQGSVPQSTFPLVRPDEYAIARMAADHLLERGYRCFGFCGVRSYNWSAARRDHFSKIIAEEGYPCHLHAYPVGRDPMEYIWERDQEALTEWLHSLPKPLGVFASDDQHGRKVLDACRQGAMQVPAEVAVVGVDNDVPLCEVCDPPLSSVIPDDTQVGYEAARLLDFLMKGGTWVDRTILIKSAGVETRHSTDTLAIDDRIVANALQYVRQHACEGVNVEDVVKRAHISRRLLQKRFKDAVGRTMNEELLRVRLNQARFLLEHASMSIAEVSAACGFKHHAYFGKMFKREIGVTPLTYRQEHQGT